MSDYPIIWSPKAKITYYHILEYIEENWTAKELRAFVNRTKQVLNTLVETQLYIHIQIKVTLIDV